MNDKLKIGQEVLIHGYIDEIRKDTIIIQNEGGYFGTVECEVTGIEMHCDIEQIRAEIIQVYEQEMQVDRTWAAGLRYSLKIIDKYMTGGDAV